MKSYAPNMSRGYTFTLLELKRQYRTLIKISLQ